MDSVIKRAGAAGTMKPYMRSQHIDAAKARAWRAIVANAYPVANFQSGVQNAMPMAFFYYRMMRS
jgi:hypothetical protein